MQRVQNRGFSLIELMLVLAIVSSIIVGGMAVYWLVNQKERGVDARRQLLQIKQGTKSVFPYGVYGNGDITVELGNADKFYGMKGVVPSDPSHPKSAWDGTVVVTAFRVGAVSTVSAFRIDFGNVPRAECKVMAESFRFDADLISLAIGANILHTNNIGSGASQLTDANIIDACNAPTNSGVMGWTFR